MGTGYHEHGYYATVTYRKYRACGNSVGCSSVSPTRLDACHASHASHDSDASHVSYVAHASYASHVSDPPTLTGRKLVMKNLGGFRLRKKLGWDA